MVMPFFRPSDMLQKLMMSNPDLLLGGHQPGTAAEQVLKTFWMHYAAEHAGHPVVQRGPMHWARTIPLALHGDGGRTAKKQPLEILAMEAFVGVDTASGMSSTCSCPHCQTVGSLDWQDPTSQRLGCRHASYLSKFLVFAFPSKKYSKMPGLLVALHKEACRNLATICGQGVLTAHGRWHFAVVGYKGDFEYHAKIVDYTRSYLHLGRIKEIPICPECRAGTADCPFEDISATASWCKTVHQDIPWNTPPPVTDLEFDTWGRAPSKAAAFFRRDTFHIFRHGSLAKNPHYLFEFLLSVNMSIGPICIPYIEPEDPEGPHLCNSSRSHASRIYRFCWCECQALYMFLAFVIKRYILLYTFLLCYV